MINIFIVLDFEFDMLMMKYFDNYINLIMMIKGLESLNFRFQYYLTETSYVTTSN